MENEDIITALKNAVERGESLETAKKILINSGYNSKDVEEASKFIGGGVISAQKPKPDEELTMPSQKKGIFSKIGDAIHDKTKDAKKEDIQPLKKEKQTQPLQKQPASPKQEATEIKKEITPEKVPTTAPPEPLTKQISKIGPRGPSHMKEIILLVVLLGLIGFLILTIAFKDKLLNLFS